jgi:hypothetical protein
VTIHAPLSISTAAKKASYDARIGDPEYIGQEGKTEDFEMSKSISSREKRDGGISLTPTCKSGDFCGYRL